MAGKSIMIRGPFSEDDMAIMLAAMREVEKRQPDREFMLAIYDDALSLQEGREVVQRIFPREAGEEPVVSAHSAMPDGELTDGGILQNSIAIAIDEAVAGEAFMRQHFPTGHEHLVFMGGLSDMIFSLAEKTPSATLQDFKQALHKYASRRARAGAH